jgi:hypothetical protein
LACACADTTLRPGGGGGGGGGGTDARASDAEPDAGSLDEDARTADDARGDDAEPTATDAGEPDDAGLAPDAAGADATAPRDAEPRPDAAPRDAGAGDAAPGPDVGPTNNLAVFFFGHSLTNWSPRNAASGAPEDVNRTVGYGLCHVAAAAGTPCCYDGRYPTQGSSLVNVASAYGSPPTAATIDANGRHTNANPCAGFTRFERIGWTHFVLVQNNFNISRDNARNWLGWTQQASFGPSADALFDFAKDRSNPSARVFLYEIPPGLNMNPSTFDTWIRDGDTSLAGRGYGRFAAMHEQVQDSINGARGNRDVYLVPFNRLIARALGPGGLLAGQTLTQFAWDSAPHYRAEYYYLAGVLHYMVLTGRRPPAGYAPPAIVPPAIRNVFDRLVDDWWTAINTPPLRDRVFGPLP